MSRQTSKRSSSTGLRQQQQQPRVQHQTPPLPSPPQPSNLTRLNDIRGEAQFRNPTTNRHTASSVRRMANALQQHQNPGVPRVARIADARHMNRMNQTLQHMHADVEKRLKECLRNGDEMAQLAYRAERLKQRLALMQEKLTMCFAMGSGGGRGGDDDDGDGAYFKAGGGSGGAGGGQGPSKSLQIILQQLADVDTDGAPPEFVCPISQCLMVDPVSTADGQVYDRAAIVQWFATFLDGRTPTSPLTNLELKDLTLKERPELRVEIQQFMKGQREGREGGGESAAAIAKTPEEPSLRQAPPGTLSNGAALRQRAKTTTIEDDDEERELQEAIRKSLEMEKATSAKKQPSSGPIWSSAVVPAEEENSRVLNLLRVNDDIEVPTTESVTVGVRDLLRDGVRHQRAMSNYQQSSLYQAPKVQKSSKPKFGQGAQRRVTPPPSVPSRREEEQKETTVEDEDDTSNREETQTPPQQRQRQQPYRPMLGPPPGAGTTAGSSSGGAAHRPRPTQDDDETPQHKFQFIAPVSSSGSNKNDLVQQQQTEVGGDNNINKKKKDELYTLDPSFVSAKRRAGSGAASGGGPKNLNQRQRR